MTILVTGASSSVGHNLVHQLSAAGKRVRAMSRTPSALDCPSDVETVHGDFTDPEALLDVLDGVSQVFLLLGPDNGVDFAPIAAKAGVRGIVLLSSFTAGLEWPSGSNPIAERHRRGEQAVRDCGVPHTVLRPAPFADNVLLWTDIEGDEVVVRAPFPDVRLPYVAPVDVAALAARALVGGEHNGHMHLITGPGRLTPAELARALGRALARPVRFEPLSPAEGAAVLSAKVPAAIVEPLLEVLGPAAQWLPVSPAVQKLIGRRARGFQWWAAEHRELFATD